MGQNADQRKRTAARQRALELQQAKVQALVPAGHCLAPSGPRPIPLLGRHSFEQLAALLGEPEMVGFVLAASCRVKVWIYGTSYPSMSAVRAWGVGRYWTRPGDTVDLRTEGRTAGPVLTAKLFPFVKARAYRPEPIRAPELDSNGLPDDTPLPPPWEAQS